MVRNSGFDDTHNCSIFDPGTSTEAKSCNCFSLATSSGVLPFLSHQHRGSSKDKRLLFSAWKHRMGSNIVSN